MKRLLLAVAVAGWAALAGACSSAHHSAGPTTLSAPTTTDPYAIPPVITVDYVNKVFAALNRIQGDATRLTVQAESVTTDAQAELRSIYNEPLLDKEIANFRLGLALLSNVKRPPGDIRTSVSRIISSSPSCIFVETVSDFSAVNIHNQSTAASEYWTLRPKAAGSDPAHLNPTPWAFAYNVDFLKPTSVPNQCSV